MNVVIANTREFNPQIGGVERVSSTLASELIKRGHQVYFVAVLKGDSVSYQPVVEQMLLPEVSDIFSEVNIEIFSSFCNKKKIDIILNQAGNIENFTKLCVKVKKEAHVKLISAIHINPDYRVKNLYYKQYCEANLPLWQNVKNILRRIRYLRIIPQVKAQDREFYNYVYENSDKTVLLSKSFIPVFEKVICKSALSKIDYVTNPLSFSDIEIGLKEKIILYVGRFDYQHKRPDRLIYMWRYLHREFPDWKLVMLGDGPSMDYCQNLLRKFKLTNIELLGFQDPLPYYRKASILCMTSNIEGFGMVLIEGMSNGVIPVAYDTFESLHDIIENNITGYTIAPFKENLFMDCLRDIMTDANKRENMAQEAIKKSQRFNVYEIIDKWECIFNSL